MSEDTKTEGKYKRLFKDTWLFAISGFASKILVFLLTPLYTALLATEEYGIVDLINTTVSLAFPVLTLAITDATLRYGLEKTSNRSSVLVNSILVVLLSFFILLCLYPLSGFVDESLNNYWLYFVAIYFLMSFHDCFANYSKATGHTSVFAIQGVVQTVFLIGSNLVLLLWLRMGLHGYLISVVVSHIPPIIVMFFFAGIYKDVASFRPDFVLLKKMLVYSVPLIPSIIAWFINTSIDKFMIIELYGMGENGIYSVAHKIPTIITTVITFFINAWTISSIQNHGSEDESEYTTKIYNALSFLLTFGCIFVIALDKILARFLFSNDFFVAWRYVPFLAISAVFSSLSGFLAGPYRAAKKTISLLVSVIVGAAINVVLNLVLLNLIGVLGAAIATAISFFVVWFIRFIVVQKIVTVKPQWLVMLVSFVGMVSSSILVTCDVPYGAAISVLLLVAVALVNFRNIKACFLFVKSFFRRKNIKGEENDNNQNAI